MVLKSKEEEVVSFLGANRPVGDTGLGTVSGVLADLFLDVVAAWVWGVRLGGI